jgi:hypothetical protein
VLWNVAEKKCRDADYASHAGHEEKVVHQVGMEHLDIGQYSHGETKNSCGRLTMSASLFFSAIRASISAKVFSFMGVVTRLGVAVPERVLKVSPKKPVGRVVFCWRLRAAARVRGHGPWDLVDCWTGVVALVVAAVDVQDAALDWRAAFWRSS